MNGYKGTDMLQFTRQNLEQMYVDTPDHSKQHIKSMVLMIRDMVLYSNSMGKKTYDHFICDPYDIGLVPRAVELLQVVFPDSVITSHPHMEGRLIKITVDWSEGCVEKEQRQSSTTSEGDLRSDEVEYSESMCEPTDT